MARCAISAPVTGQEFKVIAGSAVHRKLCIIKAKKQETGRQGRKEGRRERRKGRRKGRGEERGKKIFKLSCT